MNFEAAKIFQKLLRVRQLKLSWLFLTRRRLSRDKSDVQIRSLSHVILVWPTRTQVGWYPVLPPCRPSWGICFQFPPNRSLLQPCTVWAWEPENEVKENVTTTQRKSFSQLGHIIWSKISSITKYICYLLHSWESWTLTWRFPTVEEWPLIGS